MNRELIDFLTNSTPGQSEPGPRLRTVCPFQSGLPYAFLQATFKYNYEYDYNSQYVRFEKIFMKVEPCLKQAYKPKLISLHQQIKNRVVNLYLYVKV